MLAHDKATEVTLERALPLPMAQPPSFPLGGSPAQPPGHLSHPPFPVPLGGEGPCSPVIFRPHEPKPRRARTPRISQAPPGSLPLTWAGVSLLLHGTLQGCALSYEGSGGLRAPATEKLVPFAPQACGTPPRRHLWRAGCLWGTHGPAVRVQDACHLPSRPPRPEWNWGVRVVLQGCFPSFCLSFLTCPRCTRAQVSHTHHLTPVPTATQPLGTGSPGSQPSPQDQALGSFRIGLHRAPLTGIFSLPPSPFFSHDPSRGVLSTQTCHLPGSPALQRRPPPRTVAQGHKPQPPLLPSVHSTYVRCPSGPTAHLPDTRTSTPARGVGGGPACGPIRDGTGQRI